MSDRVSKLNHERNNILTVLQMSKEFAGLVTEEKRKEYEKRKADIDNELASQAAA